MKVSTNRSSNVKHSTGNNDVRTRLARRRRARPPASTGERAAIAHFTGRFDPKGQEEAKGARKAKHKPPQAA